jgi:FkbM family methyltransferase
MNHNDFIVTTYLTKKRLPVVYTHLKSGQRVFLDPMDPFIFTHTLETREWEDHLEAVFIHSLSGKTSPVFVDVGANIGLHSLRAHKYGAKMYCFEPDPDTFDILNINMQINGAFTSELFQMACGNQSGTVQFDRSDISAGMSHIAYDTTSNDNSSNRLEVKIDTLDNMLSNVNEVSLIKIDVEGAEEQVIAGARSILSRSKDITLIMEYHVRPTLTEIIVELINNLGFKAYLFRYGQSPIELNVEHASDWQSGDIVLTHRHIRI